MNDAVLTHGGLALTFWWTAALLFGWAGWRRWCRPGTRLAALFLFAASAYIAADYAPSLARQSVAVAPDRLIVTSGHWYRPLRMNWPLSDIVRAIETRNPHWTVVDRYLILQTVDFQRRRLRQNGLFRRNREAIFRALEARGIEVDRAP